MSARARYTSTRGGLLAKRGHEPPDAAPALPLPWGAFLGNLGTRSVRAFAEWLVHSLLLLGIVAVIQGLHWCLTHLLGVPADKRFFGAIPLAWLFDGADLALLVGVAVVGVVAAVRSYQGKH